MYELCETLSRRIVNSVYLDLIKWVSEYTEERDILDKLVVYEMLMNFVSSYTVDVGFNKSN